jgi:hypothetical protein
MHVHLVRVEPPRFTASRPAKVILLETRRKARLEQLRLERQGPRPAA